MKGIDMKKLIIFLLLLFTGSVYAGTDYQCKRDCEAKGYNYQYCEAKCSYDDSPQQTTKPRNIDYQCMSNCQNKGYLYDYCRNICSY